MSFLNDREELQNKNKSEIGRKAEDLAVAYLEKQGFQIVKRNFHFGKHGEIDVIARDGEYLVFVEVKYRSNKSYGHPLESITPSKIRKLRRAAEGYLYVNKINDTPCRFDAVTIESQGESFKYELYQNVF